FLYISRPRRRRTTLFPYTTLFRSWNEMVETMRALVRHAEASGVDLAFEPEVVNVVDTAEKAERLIAEVGSPRLRLVMDPANYFRSEEHTSELQSRFDLVCRLLLEK